MANKRLLVFICKRVEIIFAKEDQGRDFYSLLGFADILNVAIDIFVDIREDFATGTIVMLGNYSLFSLPYIYLNKSFDYCVDPNFCFWGTTVQNFNLRHHISNVIHVI